MVGSVSRVDGGTKRSKMYNKVRETAKAHPNYSVLNFPFNEKLVRIGNDALVVLRYVGLKLNENGKLIYDGLGFGMKEMTYIPEKYFTAENILTICNAHPHTIFGYGEVGEYQADEIPFFLLRLRALFPELYAAVVEADPKQGEKTPNFVGKRAKLLTLKTNCEYRSKNYGTFFFDGKYAIFDDYRTSFRPFNGGKMTAKIEVTEDSVIEISDNAQVTKDTILV